ncbi:transposase [Streptomyces cinereoruber]|uniref:transposase n=1 Tax=Streptomyces cinereoruber TaxID=67260 RepID=UPI00363F802A
MPLADAQWARIGLLLPDRTPGRGGRWREHREVIDAIAWKFQAESQWIHLPEKYGNWRGVCNRLRMWAIDGAWERVFTELIAQADADADLNWAVSVDSTIVRIPTRGRRPSDPSGGAATLVHPGVSASTSLVHLCYRANGARTRLWRSVGGGEISPSRRTAHHHYA